MKKFSMELYVFSPQDKESKNAMPGDRNPYFYFLSVSLFFNGNRRYFGSRYLAIIKRSIVFVTRFDSIQNPINFICGLNV
jgi:hypothetical protein